MKITLKLPRLSLNMQEATLTQWLKSPGESFAEGDQIYAIETEKVVTEVEAPCAGVLLEIFVAEGSEVEVGAPVCRVESST